MKPRHPLGVALGIGAVLIGACSACTAAGGAPAELPEFASLQQAVDAVDEQVGCLDEVEGPTSVHDAVGLVTTESVKCTETVEVFYFDRPEDLDHVATTLSAAAEADGSLQFVEGRNWFVVDFTEVTAGASPDGSRDLAGLAEALGADFTDVE